MEPQTDSRPGMVRRRLPWIIAVASWALYLVTLNHWVNLSSLSWVAQVTGWDAPLPQQAPLFFLVTLPFRVLPAAWQPLALNAFTALLASLTLGLLARSIALLPHDRTHDQRQRERSEFSLLSIPTAWIPPVLATAACAMEWTFWENAIAASNEMLSLLVFAYAIRCLLEFRQDQRQAWLYQASFFYALGMTNNAGMIGLLPFFVAAVLWMMGWAFFDGWFLARMLAFAAAGLSLYLLLPLVWIVADGHFSLLGVLRSELGAQKVFLFLPGLRQQAALLALTSILPVILMGIRWPSSSGDTSAAGNRLTQVMFRVMHLLFLAACLWVVFDFQFSPRALGMGFSFLTFYYLTALSIGYYSGYVLLVFAERQSRRRHRHSTSGQGLNILARLAVYVAVLAVPAALAYRNLPRIRGENGDVLKDFARLQASSLPNTECVALSDDAFDLLLLEGYFSLQGSPRKHLLLYSKGLPYPYYQKQVEERFPGRWKNLATPDGDTLVSPITLVQTLIAIAQKTVPSIPVYYLHPSFGYYFEGFYTIPHGLALQMKPYATNEFFAPELPSDRIAHNETFWSSVQTELNRAEKLAALSVADGSYVANFYSRALNAWGVRLQRQDKLAQAGRRLEQAAELSTNNIPAAINFAFNRALRNGQAPPSTTLNADSIEERFGALYRQWDEVLIDNGPFDAPDFCFNLGNKFAEQRLFRQAATEFRRVAQLQPKNPTPVLSLATVYLNAGQPDKALQLVDQVRQSAKTNSLPETNQVVLAQLEAGAYFAQDKKGLAEKLLLQAQERFPTSPILLDSLIEFYGTAGRWTNALAVIDRSLQASPQDTSILFKKASIEANLGMNPEALRLVDQILKLQPNDTPTLLLQGGVYLQQKNYERALAVFEQVLDLDPTSLEAQLSAGAAYLETKAFNKAVTFFTRVLQKQPRYWPALRNRAIANLRRGRLNAARRDYERLLTLQPNYYPAFYGLAEIAYQKKDSSAAERNYQLYLKYAPNSAAPELITEKQQVLNRLKELRPSKS